MNHGGRDREDSFGLRSCEFAPGVGVSHSVCDPRIVVLVLESSGCAVSTVIADPEDRVLGPWSWFEEVEWACGIGEPGRRGMAPGPCL